jgi:hypothetical protein
MGSDVGTVKSLLELINDGHIITYGHAGDKESCIAAAIISCELTYKTREILYRWEIHLNDDWVCTHKKDIHWAYAERTSDLIYESEIFFEEVSSELKNKELGAWLDP